MPGATYFVTEYRKGSVEPTGNQPPAGGVVGGIRRPASPSFASSNASYSLFDEASANYETAKKEPTGFSNAPYATPERGELYLLYFISGL